MAPPQEKIPALLSQRGDLPICVLFVPVVIFESIAALACTSGYTEVCGQMIAASADLEARRGAAR